MRPVMALTSTVVVHVLPGHSHTLGISLFLQYRCKSLNFTVRSVSSRFSLRDMNGSQRKALSSDINMTRVCVCQVVDLPSTLKVEVYPVEIFLCLHSNMENVTTAQFSRTDNIREFVCKHVVILLGAFLSDWSCGPPHAYHWAKLLSCVCLCVDSIQRTMCQAFSVAQGSECRLWMKSSDSSCERLRNIQMSVLDACLSSGMVRTRLTLTHVASQAMMRLVV